MPTGIRYSRVCRDVDGVLLLLLVLESHLQVTTVLPGVALLYLTYNLAKPWAIRWAQENTETGCVQAGFQQVASRGPCRSCAAGPPQTYAGNPAERVFAALTSGTPFL